MDGNANLVSLSFHIQFHFCLKMASHLTVFSPTCLAVVNSEVIKTWQGEEETALHALHLTASVGSMVAPLITEPFLAPSELHNTTFAILDLDLDPSRSDGNSSDPMHPNITLPDCDEGSTEVHVAFMITACVTFVCTTPYPVQFFCRQRGGHAEGKTDKCEIESSFNRVRFQKGIGSNSTSIHPAKGTKVRDCGNDFSYRDLEHHFKQCFDEEVRPQRGEKQTLRDASETGCACTETSTILVSESEFSIAEGTNNDTRRKTRLKGQVKGSIEPSARQDFTAREGGTSSTTGEAGKRLFKEGTGTSLTDDGNKSVVSQFKGNKEEDHGEDEEGQKEREGGRRGKGGEGDDDDDDVVAAAAAADDDDAVAGDDEKEETEEEKPIQLKQQQQQQQPQDEDEKSKPPPCNLSNMPRATHLSVVAAMCLFYMFFVAVEVTFPCYLTTFLVLELKWAKSRGVRATFCYWLTFAITRLVCLPLSAVLSPLSLLLGGLG